jgi:hypothetical protein
MFFQSVLEGSLALTRWRRPVSSLLTPERCRLRQLRLLVVPRSLVSHGADQRRCVGNDAAEVPPLGYGPAHFTVVVIMR